MIRAAVFDLGGVLEIVDDDRWLAEWVARWQGLELDEAHARERQADFWNAYCGVLDEPLRDFVRELRDTLIVASLSNSADGAREEEERRYGFDELFDERVYSHEIGVQKPDAGIYRYTQELLGVEPHEIVFLDDRQSAVDGARLAGWHAVLHESTPTSIAAIRALLT